MRNETLRLQPDNWGLEISHLLAELAGLKPNLHIAQGIALGMNVMISCAL